MQCFSGLWHRAALDPTFFVFVFFETLVRPRVHLSPAQFLLLTLSVCGGMDAGCPPPPPYMWQFQTPGVPFLERVLYSTSGAPRVLDVLWGGSLGSCRTGYVLRALPNWWSRHMHAWQRSHCSYLGFWKPCRLSMQACAVLSWI